MYYYTAHNYSEWSYSECRQGGDKVETENSEDTGETEEKGTRETGNTKDTGETRGTGKTRETKETENTTGQTWAQRIQQGKQRKQGREH